MAKIFADIPEFHRDIFRHDWRFDDPKLIYQVVLKHCKTMFHADSKIDVQNFNMTMDDFFPTGVYPEIKQHIIEDWKNDEQIVAFPVDTRWKPSAQSLVKSI